MDIKHLGQTSCLVLEALLLLLLVAACGQQPQSSGATASPTPTGVVVVSPTAAPADDSALDSAETPTPSPTSTKVLSETPPVTPPDNDGFNGPDPQSLPEAPAPLGLSDIDLPDDVESIIELFNDLPANLAGNQRAIQSANPGSITIWASYGKTQPVGCGMNGLQAMDVSTGDFFPQGWTAERVIAVFTTGADWEVEDFGKDGELFWVRWKTTCGTADISGTDSIFTVSWGAAGSPWFFSASAGDPGDWDEFTAAFVAAAK